MTHPEGEIPASFPVSPYMWALPTDATIEAVREELMEGEIVHEVLVGVGMTDVSIARDVTFINRARHIIATEPETFKLQAKGIIYPIPRAIQTRHEVLLGDMPFEEYPAFALSGKFHLREYLRGRNRLLAVTNNLLRKASLPRLPNPTLQ